MMYQNEKLFMYNPFDLPNWTEEQLKEQYNILNKKIDMQADTMMGLANNVENLSNQLYLIGEMIARLTEKANLLKAKIDKDDAINVYIERTEWEKKNTGKAPSIKYFEALAMKKSSDDREQLAKTDSDLKRFKVAYESIEAKMNSQKKKMEAVKFDIAGAI